MITTINEFKKFHDTNENVILLKESIILYNLVETVLTNGTFGDKKDVTKKKQSIAGKLEPFFASMSKLSLHELKELFIKILNDADTQVSNYTKHYWLNQTSEKTTVKDMLLMLSNLYLGGAKMHVPNKTAKDYGNDSRY